ncbi:hypothetical protein Taro_039205 [Colocasia esculenta]|uniref:Glycosyltransferase n=1 Tax=Colocasia esculenta TaxID=4460 RepID=A0A843WPG5_COLES|nr:hypothetical protein [Colocasia esculenta]
MASPNLHIFFLPLLTPGHMLPVVDMAKLFAQRGVRATLVTTPGNAARIRDSLERGSAGGRVEVLQVEFPSSLAGLPDGSDTLAASGTPEVTEKFFGALNALRQPVERLVREHAPDCLISDTFFPWTVDVAAEFGIPRVVFHASGTFTLTALGAVIRSCPHLGVSDDAEAFVLPGLLDHIEMTRAELPEFILSTPDYMKEMAASQFKSYGIVLNTFQELEPAYGDKVDGLKTWSIGPVGLCNVDGADQAVRGEKASGDNAERCLSWLDAQAPGSVPYVCFGSLCRFTRAQLHELALGLEAAGHPFLWVLRDVDGSGAAELPEGFEERTKGRALVLRGWAPQILILGHRAVGGYVIHCGWNSIVEAVTAGLPMVTWPLFHEQFFNEKFVLHVLRAGVPVGTVSCRIKEEERVLVGREKIGRAVARVMGGGAEADALRRRARELSTMAKKAVEVGGSSHRSLDDLIQELIGLKKWK